MPPIPGSRSWRWSMTIPVCRPTTSMRFTRIRSRYTSPTNIGAYIWSTLAARDIGIIKPEEARERIAQTLARRQRWSATSRAGSFTTGTIRRPAQKLTTWPANGSTRLSVPVQRRQRLAGDGPDDGEQRRAAATRARHEAIVDEMDFGFYYDPAAGLLRGGFWDAPPPGARSQGNYRGRGPNVFYTCHHYGSLNTEPRIASYIAIAKDGSRPPTTSRCGAPSPTPATGAGRR